MPRSTPRVARPRTLSETSLQALMRLLAERGLSQHQIESGLEYAGSSGAGTMREGYELAMSRVLFDDAELAAGKRFDASEQPATG